MWGMGNLIHFLDIEFYILWAHHVFENMTSFLNQVQPRTATYFISTIAEQNQRINGSNLGMTIQTFSARPFVFEVTAVSRFLRNLHCLIYSLIFVNKTIRKTSNPRFWKLSFDIMNNSSNRLLVHCNTNNWFNIRSVSALRHIQLVTRSVLGLDRYCSCSLIKKKKLALNTNRCLQSEIFWFDYCINVLTQRE
jgi:hypothetical protein